MEGHIAVLSWARPNNGCPGMLKSTMEYAAQWGQLATVRSLRPNGCAWQGWVCEAAAFGGHLAVLQWLHAEGCPCARPERVCERAAEGGHMHVLQWLRANGYAWDKRTCTRARENGHTAVLAWAMANGCPAE
jgi:hypothetical protein